MHKPCKPSQTITKLCHKTSFDGYPNSVGTVHVDYKSIGNSMEIPWKSYENSMFLKVCSVLRGLRILGSPGPVASARQKAVKQCEKDDTLLYYKSQRVQVESQRRGYNKKAAATDEK
jgi:hypothetical protein